MHVYRKPDAAAASWIQSVGNQRKVVFQKDCYVENEKDRRKYEGDLAITKYPTTKNLASINCTKYVSTNN